LLPCSSLNLKIERVEKVKKEAPRSVSLQK
jgi:hypothetical protein